MAHRDPRAWVSCWQPACLPASLVPGLSRGFAWLLKAAALGQRTAQWYVGRMYVEGEGTPRDQARAVDWLGRAALQDIETAWDDLDRLLRAGSPEALGWLRDKAEQGDMRAQVRLARAFRDGQGVNRDLTQALEWYARVGANWVEAALHREGDGRGGQTPVHEERHCLTGLPCYLPLNP